MRELSERCLHMDHSLSHGHTMALRCLLWWLRGAEAEDAYPSDKMAVF